MPVEIAQPIQQIDEQSFHRIDHIVTGEAFRIHNALGRYLNESNYQAALHQRISGANLRSVREVKLPVSLDDFHKDYFLDLLVANAVIVETKAVARLTSKHRAQVLNYLYLCGLQHATLLNFRTERVEHEFVSTRLTTAERKQAIFSEAAFRPRSSRCTELPKWLRRMISEWGACLDPNLYRDALSHFLGGDQKVCQEIDVELDGTVIGSQTVHLVTSDIAFAVTSSVHQLEVTREHQRRFIRHSPLAAIHWINFNRLDVAIETIEG